VKSESLGLVGIGMVTLSVGYAVRTSRVEVNCGLIID
jgi:hypothetical protein